MQHADYQFQIVCLEYSPKIVTSKNTTNSRENIRYEYRNS